MGRNLRLSGPALVPGSVEGVPAKDVGGEFKDVPAPRRPVPNPNSGPIEARVRAALPEKLQVGFDRWMESVRSNPNKKVDVEKLLEKMSKEQVEKIVQKPADDFYAQVAEAERLSNAKTRSLSDPLRPDLAHTEWKDGVTVHYGKTPPSPIEIQHAREIQARTGESVHVFGDTPAQHSPSAHPGKHGCRVQSGMGGTARPCARRRNWLGDEIETDAKQAAALEASN
ncbi:MAG: hypothetical protein ACJ746_06700 [Bryobacteraceae bacterium]